METVECAKRYYGNKVCALDLAGAEGLFPTELYEEVFKKASKYDIPFTIHAGEAAGPESIRKALSYGAARIGHGVRCVEDEALMEELAKKEIPLEVCPTSNMQTKVFGSVNEYPLKTILARGVHATLNTDNMTVSGTDLAREKSFCIDTLKLTEKDIELMSQYSIKAAFNY
jgi:adenosine deaminase